MQYQEKLDGIESRFEELTRQMAEPELISDNDRYRKVAKQQSELARRRREVPRMEEGQRGPRRRSSDADGG